MRHQFQYIQGALFVIVLFLTSAGNAVNGFSFEEEKGSDIIIIHQPDVSKAEKEALIILSGFGDNCKRRKRQKAFFGKLEYDLYIPDYHVRKSFDLTVEKFEQFYKTHQLGEYEKVHVLSYILGSWVINSFIEQNGRNNICTIIYDRSPLQERAPQIVVDKIPLIGRIAKGKVLLEFSKIPYQSLDQDSIRIGIIVENKATKLLRMFKKKALSYGEVQWDSSSFQQKYDDLIYTPLNHDQMYFRFDVIGEDIVHFLEQGTFGETARRVPYKWDVFKKWKEGDKN